MVSLFLLLGCNLSYIVDLFAALHELASASVRTLLKLASSVRALLKPYGDTLNESSYEGSKTSSDICTSNCIRQKAHAILREFSSVTQCKFFISFNCTPIYTMTHTNIHV